MFPILVGFTKASYDLTYILFFDIDKICSNQNTVRSILHFNKNLFYLFIDLFIYFTKKFILFVPYFLFLIANFRQKAIWLEGFCFLKEQYLLLEKYITILSKEPVFHEIYYTLTKSRNFIFKQYFWAL